MTEKLNPHFKAAASSEQESASKPTEILPDIKRHHPEPQNNPPGMGTKTIKSSSDQQLNPHSNGKVGNQDPSHDTIKKKNPFTKDLDVKDGKLNPKLRDNFEREAELQDGRDHTR